MQINISCQHMSAGQSLSEYVEERLKHVVSKYFANALSAHVHFSKRSYEFKCDLVLNEGTGRSVVMKSSGASDEVHNAFDEALGKLEKQMRRYKSKLNDHHKKKKLSEAANFEAIKYVISANNSNEESSEFDIDNPVIVAEKPAEILPLTVGEAVMRMDLENLPALMFENAKTQRINVVYYRKDGNISWVDSK